ncbi:FMN-binding protein [Sediminitomix flava]|uniref:Ion-translocating oxidoreductase complex subunit G n=1 Tax=Sediminitomix flava TaxID=379075 RepID=A0A315ZIX1_SEDFL|nr:FMN-binding protein [Sediminitomix flava]PWJ44644.1 electron transport complex protein RnfG [Sediminitomix flava]
MTKEKQEIPQANEASSFKMLRAMAGIGLLCALLIVLTYEGTLPRIEQLKAEALEAAIFKVIPGTTQTKAYALKDGEFVALEGKENAEKKIYAGYNDNNELMGFAIEASGQGYADIIRILYGYDPAQQAVVGFYVLDSKETPGLGDKIEKDDNFLANFKALDVKLDETFTKIVNSVVTVKSGAKVNPWEVDGITGATISSRAIGNIIAESSKEWMPILYPQVDHFKQETAQAETSTH